MNVTIFYGFSVDEIIALSEKFSLFYLSISLMIIFLNVWFIKYLKGRVSLNRNLKMLLTIHCIFACTTSTQGLVSTIVYQSMEPCSTVISYYWSEIINLPLSSYFMLIVVMLIFISLERTYATCKHHTFGSETKNLLPRIWIVIVINTLPTLILQAFSLKSLDQNQQITLALASTFILQTVTTITGLLSIFVILILCSTQLSVKKTGNRQKMKQFDCYRGYVDDQKKTAVDDNVFTSDQITKIYACATMWHETEAEMICMLKSIFR